MAPVVSVIIPVFNRCDIVSAAISSVLGQSFTDLEVIVVDDGSTDDIEGTIARFSADDRIRLIRQRNGGVSSARNLGIDAARGRLIAFLDSDDTWMPEKLERQIAATEPFSQSGPVLVTAQSRVMANGYSRILPERLLRHDEDPAEFLYADGGFAQVSSLLVSRSHAQAIRFDEALSQYEDHLFFIATIEGGARLIQMEEPLVLLCDQERNDRLSRRKSRSAALKFRAAAGPLLNDRAKAAFEAVELAPELWPAQPFSALSLQIHALRSGAISGRKFARTLMRTLLPNAIGCRLRALRHAAQAQAVE